MSSQVEGHFTIPQNGISDTNEPLMSVPLPYKDTFPVSQGWPLIAISTVIIKACDQIFQQLILPIQYTEQHYLYLLIHILP